MATGLNPTVISAGKRLAIEESEWWPDWWCSYSPRNSNGNAEGQWCQWVHLARLILADERTAEQMPEHHRPYPDAPHLYDESHPDCTACAAEASEATS